MERGTEADGHRAGPFVRDVGGRSGKRNFRDSGCLHRLLFSGRAADISGPDLYADPSPGARKRTLPQMRRSGKILLCPRARSARRPEISRGHALLRRKTAESVPETSGRCAFAVGVKFRRRARTRCRVLRIRARTVRERLLPGLPLVETAGAQRENSPDRSSSQPDDLFSRRVRMDDA